MFERSTKTIGFETNGSYTYKIFLLTLRCNIGKLITKEWAGSVRRGATGAPPDPILSPLYTSERTMYPGFRNLCFFEIIIFSERSKRMGCATTLTSHALIRLANRSLLTPEEAIRILDNCLFVLLSKEHDTNRVHKLIYDERNQNFIVAVQDETNGEVITFHPAINNNDITNEALLEAKQLILKSEPIYGTYVMQSDQIIRFRFECQDSLTGKKRFLILKLPALGYFGNPDLEMDIDLQDKIINFLSVSLDPGEIVRYGFVKFTNKSQCKPFCIEIIKDLLSNLKVSA